MGSDSSSNDSPIGSAPAKSNWADEPERRRRQFWSMEQRTFRWFVAEITVVVAGVLIALAMNSWWQIHRDRDVEQGYLRAIVSELDSTSASLERANQRNERALTSMKMLLSASLDPSEASHDSIVIWRGTSNP